MCVWAGTTATLPCRHDYPSGHNCEARFEVPCFCRGSQGVCSPHRPDQPVLLQAHRLHQGKLCQLLGSDSGVKLGHAGQYHFRFETDQPLGRWTSPDTITLDATGSSTLLSIATSVTLETDSKVPGAWLETRF